MLLCLEELVNQLQVFHGQFQCGSHVILSSIKQGKKFAEVLTVDSNSFPNTAHVQEGSIIIFPITIHVSLTRGFRPGKCYLRIYCQLFNGQERTCLSRYTMSCKPSHTTANCHICPAGLTVLIACCNNQPFLRAFFKVSKIAGQCCQQDNSSLLCGPLVGPVCC